MDECICGNLGAIKLLREKSILYSYYDHANDEWVRMGPDSKPKLRVRCTCKNEWIEVFEDEEV